MGTVLKSWNGSKTLFLRKQELHRQRDFALLLNRDGLFVDL